MAVSHGELVVGYLDDVYIVTPPHRALAAYNLVTQTIADTCGVLPNLGKTVVWNKAGVEPAGVAELGDSVWRGGGPQAGIRVLGTPFGSAAYVDGFGQALVDRASNLFEKASRLPQLQHTWLLFYFCVVPKLNHLLRQLPPELSANTATAFEQLTANSLAWLLYTSPSPRDRTRSRMPSSA